MADVDAKSGDAAVEPEPDDLLEASPDVRAPPIEIRLRGQDRHHIVEAAFKALGLALRDALVDTGETFSTKGSISLRVE